MAGDTVTAGKAGGGVAQVTTGQGDPDQAVQPVDGNGAASFVSVPEAGRQPP